MEPPQWCCAAPTSSGRIQGRVRVEVSGVNPTDWKSAQLRDTAGHRPFSDPASRRRRGDRRGALTGVANDAWTFAGTVVIWSPGEATMGGIPYSIVARLAPTDASGRYQGSIQWTFGLARFTTLSVGTASYAGVGPGVVWWFSAIAGVGAAIGVGAFAPAATPDQVASRDAASTLAADAEPAAVSSRTQRSPR
jgi:hypothetical protein